TFINLLVTAGTEPGGPLLGLITLRGEFYDRPMDYPQFGRLLGQNSKSVLPMSVSGLRAGIEKPAAPADVRRRFFDGLIGDLLFELRSEAAAMPLLEFTLDQLFQHRVGHRLTLAAYHEIGGVRGALTKHAEDTYLGLPDEDHRRLARALFLRLIEPGVTEQ